MKCKAYTALLITFLLLFLFCVQTVHAADFEWPSTLIFLLPAYNSTVGFSTTAYFDTFAWNDANATSITFTNINTTGDTLASFTVSTTTNLTITQLMIANKLIFTTVGAGTITLSLPSNPVSMDFDGTPQGTPSWYGTSATITTTIGCTVTLDWTPTGGGGGGGGGGGNQNLPIYVKYYKGHDIWQILSNGIYVFYIDTNSTVTWPLLIDVEAYIDSLGTYTPPIVVTPTDWNNPTTYAIVGTIGAVLVLAYTEEKQKRKLGWKKTKTKKTKWKRNDNPWK